MSAMFESKNYILLPTIMPSPCLTAQITVKICEDSIYVGRLSCSRPKRINVISANYGRLDGQTCFHSGLVGNTNCRAGNSLSVVQAACQNKVNCGVSANNAFFGGDLCVGIKKYALITYQCDG